MATHPEYPEFVSRFYDPIYSSIRSRVDHEYFVNEMRAAGGPVLEVGVGTGRMFLDALAAGVNVFGIDVSESMLHVLRSKLREEDQSRVRLMDVRQLGLRRKFDLIAAPFRVFSHLIEVDDQLAALNAIAAHLTSQGRLVFDLFAPDYALMANPPQRRLDFDGEHAPGESLKRYSSVVNHPSVQVNEVTFDYEWAEDGHALTRSWTFPMRYYFRYELEHLIARSELALIELCGDYSGGAVTDLSKDYVAVCARR